LGIVALMVLAGSVSAHPQATTEYAGASSVGVSAASSQPKLFNPQPASQPNRSLFLVKPTGLATDVVNRNWLEQQAGNNGARLSVNTTPPQTSVWIDGKYVGHTPFSVALPVGKHHLSFLGPRQEDAQRDVEITKGQDKTVSVDLKETYPTSISIPAFGNHPH
jgi:hypothetical protein